MGTYTRPPYKQRSKVTGKMEWVIPTPVEYVDKPGSNSIIRKAFKTNK
jgi:hypothetical protein